MQEMITKMLQEQVKGQLNKQLASSLGVKESQAQDMIENSLPYLLGGLSKNASSKEGAESLLEALKTGGHDGREIEEAEAQSILGHILGNKEDAAEAAVAKKAGVDPAKAKKTMMVMAPMVMAMLGKVVKSDKLNADKLSEVVTDVAKNKDLSGAGMKLVMQFLDQDKDGDIKDDFFRIAQKWLSNKLTKR